MSGLAAAAAFNLGKRHYGTDLQRLAAAGCVPAAA